MSNLNKSKSFSTSKLTSCYYTTQDSVYPRVDNDSTRLTSLHINPRGDNTVQQLVELLPRDFCDSIPRELTLIRFSDIPDYLLYSSLSTSTIVDLYALVSSNFPGDLLLTTHAKIDVDGRISFFYADQRSTSPYQGKHFTFSRSETLVNILKNFPEY